MSKKKWTKDQQNAIDIKDRNLLVSAAAGSGKTAVLVNRIVKRLLSGEISIDRMVVVTFTKAAAAEMKERIRKSLEKALKQTPDNLFLYNQISLLGDAPISTIDSFCQRLLRTGFEEAGVEPDFRIAEPGEIALLESDVCGEIIEKFYIEKGEEFYDFAAAFGGKKNDADIEQLVMSLYINAINNPWPREWLTKLPDTIKSGIDVSPEQNPVLSSYFDFLKLRFKSIKESYDAFIPMLNEENGLEKYLKCALPEADHFGELLSCKDYDSLLRRIDTTEWITLPAVKDSECDVEVKKTFKELREKGKKIIKEILPGLKRINNKEEYLYPETDYIYSVVKLLTEMTLEFIDKLDKEKRDRNIVTFNDLEHLALKILVKRENGISIPTTAAKELQDYYQEIMTDEYQDSNLLQEEILNAVSNGYNRYMVGDVKQSIYGFRKARPDIFTEKYEKYDTYKDGHISENDTKILLQKNFRSRGIVLDAVNAVFRQSMSKNCGGIDYTTDQELVPGLEYPEPQPFQKVFDNADGKVCIEYICEDNDERRPRNELEAELAACRINEMMESGRLVYDSDTGGYRKLRFGDIAILSRKKEMADVCVDVLMRAGISAYAESNESYLDTFELRPVISMLKILDNPLDDIALASVLLSYFGGFEPSEIARLKVTGRYDFLYHNLKAYDNDDDLYKKTKIFLSEIDDLRKKAVNSSVYDIIWEIIYETGYYRYIGTTPSPEGRFANIGLLMNRAASFSGTSYNGLFQFLRYLDRLKEARQEIGEVSVLGEYDDVVRIMTIHKSKGLEFPVVFVLGMTGRFNLTNDSERMVLKDGLGVAVSVIDTARRLKRISVFKNAIMNRIKPDEIGEEIRLLYVAMTRAREKLFLVGSGKDENVDKYIKDHSGKVFDTETLFSIKNYFEICMSAAAFNKNNNLFDINISDSKNLITPEESKSVSQPVKKTGKKETEKSVTEPYAYEHEIIKKPKVTVTELKRMAMESEEETAVDNRIYYDKGSGITCKKGFSASERGNVYHKIMECLDMSDTEKDEDIIRQIDLMTAQGLISPQGATEIKINDIRTFLDSETGKAAVKAFSCGKLIREQEFMMGIKQDDMTDLLIVQGVIDMYIEEDDGIILVDHKTDRVGKKTGEKTLTDRYRQQLYYYKKALEQATGKKVKKCLIYSFSLGKEIEIVI